MRRLGSHAVSGILGALLLAVALWWALEVPMAVQIQLYPLSDEHPLRVNGWCPMPGTTDGIWWSYPAVCDPTTPTAPADTTPATIDGSES